MARPIEACIRQWIKMRTFRRRIRARVSEKSRDFFRGRFAAGTAMIEPYAGSWSGRRRRPVKERQFSLRAINKILVFRAMRAGPRLAIEKISCLAKQASAEINPRLFMNCFTTLLALAGDPRLALIRPDLRRVDGGRAAFAFAGTQRAAEGAAVYNL